MFINITHVCYFFINALESRLYEAGGFLLRELSDLSVIIKNLYLIDPVDCKYQINRKQGILISIYIPDDTDLTNEEKGGFANTFLWHAFGERHVMDNKIRAEVKVGIPRVNGLMTAADVIKVFPA